MRPTKRLLTCAAMGVILWGGVTRAQTAPAVASGTATAPAAEPPARKPLMDLLDKAGWAKPLDDANINIFGFVEASSTWNFQGVRNNDTRVFDTESQQLDLNQVDLAIERTVDASKGKFDVGGRIEWIYGTDAAFIHSNGLFDWYNGPDNPGEQWDLNQAYLDFAIPLGKGLRVRVGKFVTLLGYETINPTNNPLYSHSYLFGYAIPFTHTGILGTYTFNDQWTLNAGVTRGWEQALKDNNSDAPDFLGNVVWTMNDKWTFTLSNTTGPEQAADSRHLRTVFDLVASYAATKDLTLALNGDYGFESHSVAAGGQDAQWYGFAGYATQKLNDTFSLNARVEWFDDTDGARGLGTNVYEATVGVTITPFPNDHLMSNLKLRPELRWDYAQHKLFDSGSEHNQFTAAIEGYFTF